MVLWQSVFTAWMFLWWIVPTKDCVSELSVINSVHSLLMLAIDQFLLWSTHLVEVILCYALPADLPMAGQVASPCCLPLLPQVVVCVSALDIKSFCHKLLFHCMCLLFWFILHRFSAAELQFLQLCLSLSLAFARISSVPMSMFFYV